MWNDGGARARAATEQNTLIISHKEIGEGGPGEDFGQI